MSSIVCRICGASTTIGHENPDTIRALCGRCGIYLWHPSSDFLGYLFRPEDKAKLAGHIRTQNSANIAPLMTPSEVKRIVAGSLPRLKERADLALRYLLNETNERRLLEGQFTPLVSGAGLQDDDEFQTFTYSKDHVAARHVLEVLRDDQLIYWDGPIFRMQAKGRLKGEELLATAGRGTQGFVAMSFDTRLNDVYAAGLSTGIRNAGYRAVRIDEKEHNRGITDEILAEIRNSRFVVVDYTFHSHGAYFEAGFALGLGLPVFPTCHSDEFGKLHFDIRHINTVKWTTPGDLADKLSKRIRAVLGRGPLE